MILGIRVARLAQPTPGSHGGLPVPATVVDLPPASAGSLSALPLPGSTGG